MVANALPPMVIGDTSAQLEQREDTQQAQYPKGKCILDDQSRHDRQHVDDTEEAECVPLAANEEARRVFDGEQEGQGHFDVLEPSEVLVGPLLGIRRQEDNRQDDEGQCAVIQALLKRSRLHGRP